MKKRNWFERLTDALGGGQQGARRAAGASKHGRAKSPQRNWRMKKRLARKRQRQARRAQRGKR